MIRRLFWILLGVLLGVWVLRRLDAFTQASRPGAVAQRTGRRVGGTQARLRDAVAAGRDAAREHEHDLRGRYSVPSLLDLAALERDDDDDTSPSPPEAP